MLSFLNDKNNHEYINHQNIPAVTLHWAVLYFIIFGTSQTLCLQTNINGSRLTQYPQLHIS